MNRAMAYLWVTLAKRKALHFLNSLRRPTTLIGFLAVVCLVGFCFHFRRHEIMGHLVEPRSLTGGALIMLCGSLFRGFLQRGLVFDPADIEFMFTSPFTRRQLLAYRLSSNYCFALLQSVVFLIIFTSHLTHPVVAAVCLALFQIACFHLATAAAIFGGAIPEDLHHRLRWMMLGAYFFITALYLRTAWDLRIVPRVLIAPLSQLLFYPAVITSDIANAPAVHSWTRLLSGSAHPEIKGFLNTVLYLVGFTTAALFSFWVLLRQKADIFEPALETTARHAERRSRIEQGRRAELVGSSTGRSYNLPRILGFQGVRAIIWKNLVAARRSKRELLWVGGFSFIYTGFIIALLCLYHYHSKKSPVPPPSGETAAFHLGIGLFLATLTFFLQRMVPFDFRRDGHHLLNFRILPFSSLGITCAELAVPTAFCLALQAPCIIALLLYAKFPWLLLLIVPMAFPAIVLALNTVWNMHYLLAATQRASGQSVSAVGTLMVVALSFLVFYPAGWTGLRVGQYLPNNSGIQLPVGASVFVQYVVDLLLLFILARLYDKLELSREAP
jgi:hypothetical protein